jgi:hypothetical protein
VSPGTAIAPTLPLALPVLLLLDVLVDELVVPD